MAIRLDPRLVSRSMNPASDVHLIHRDRLVESIPTVSILHPAGVGPAVSLKPCHNGTVVGPNLVLKTVGISFLVAVPLLGANFVFVESSCI